MMITDTLYMKYDYELTHLPIISNSCSSPIIYLTTQL